MAGLLTSANDISLYNSGAGSASSRVMALPLNAAVGETLFAILCSGVTQSGKVFGVTSGSSGVAWAQVALLRYSGSAGAFQGAIFWRTLDASDVSRGVVSVSNGAANRLAVSLSRTSGVDTTALTALGLQTTADIFAPSATTSIGFAAVPSVNYPALLLRIAALNMSAPTSDPFSATSSSANESVAIVNSGYVANVATLTSVWVGQKVLAANDSTAAAAFNWANSGVTARAISHGITIPLLASSRSGKPKVYDGASFVARNVKVWDGTSWVTRTAKVWDGTSWVASR